jgi:hypothetical protein
VARARHPPQTALNPGPAQGKRARAWFAPLRDGDITPARSISEHDENHRLSCSQLKMSLDWRRRTYGMQPERLRSNSPKNVPTAQNCLLKSMGVFGCDLSEKPLKNLAKASDFQAEYEGSIPFTRSNFFNGLSQPPG